MDREELIERICPTDATYECGRGDCESNCQNCGVLLNALLDEYDKHIRADAEREFQNSDYWNDYIAKVIADTRTDERVRVIDELQSFAQWLWDSHYLVNEAFAIRLVEQYKQEHTDRDVEE